MKEDMVLHPAWAPAVVTLGLLFPAVGPDFVHFDVTQIQTSQARFKQFTAMRAGPSELAQHRGDISSHQPAR